MKERLLLRALRRKTSLEAQTVEDLVRQEFLRAGAPDLEVSVYEVENGEVTQATAEHAASFTAPGDRVSISMTPPDGAELSYEEGGTCFTFTRERHRSILLFDAAELSAMVAAVFPHMATRVRRTSRSDLGKYVAGRLTAGDSEWVQLCAEKSDWARLAARHQEQQTLEPADASPPRPAARTKTEQGHGVEE